MRSRRRKAKGWSHLKKRNHQKAPDPWQENYERLRLVLGSVIESQGGEIKVSMALCEQYDVTKVLNVAEDDDGNYVLTLAKPLNEKKPEEDPDEEPTPADPVPEAVAADNS